MTFLVVRDIYIKSKLMVKCDICNLEFNNTHNLDQHIKKCEKLSLIKDEILDLYIDKNYSVKELRHKFNIQSNDIKNLLGSNIRTLSEAVKIGRKKYPEKFKHTEESKRKLREVRLKFMRENPEKTAWRLSNLSYPEKLCVDFIESNNLHKKYSIVREYSVFPYFIDFAFPNEMVALEIDGSQHLVNERKKQDEKKDKLLNELGWFVIRVSEKEIKTNIRNVFDQVILILNKKPKKNNMKIGMVVNPRKKQKKQRNEFGFTQKQVESIKNQRKQERPPYSVLLEQIKKIGYSKTGELYGVSDNTIRKWIKSHNKGLY